MCVCVCVLGRGDFVQEHAPDAEGFKGSKVVAFRAQWLEYGFSFCKAEYLCAIKYD